MDKVEHYSNLAIEMAMAKGPKVLFAIVTLLIGLWIIKILAKILRRVFAKSQFDSSLQDFFTSVITTILKVLLIISIISTLGIETTSFVAILAAMGFAVGLALQGTLSNFAGGVLVLLFKPYRAGDVIEVTGYTGKVTAIEIFVTKLTTPDNKTVIIPNGITSNSSITNYTVLGERRVDLVIGVSYNADIKQSKEILMNILTADARVLKEPAPVVVVSELADSSVNFAVRPWTKNENYWGVYSDVLEKAKYDLEAAGIEIPFPQTDVHVHNVKG